ncbi:MAG: sulfate transporter family protein [Rhizobiaceae bacterium]|nr:sulfate transporter family protein [Rhizobiaceae bacterium]
MNNQGLIGAISKSLSQLFSKPFRSVLWKSIGLTIALFIGFWFVLQAAHATFLAPLLADYAWVSTMLAWVLGAGLIIGMGFLIAPVTSVFAGVFLDEIADEVEGRHYPHDPKGVPLSLSQSIGITARFLGLVVIGNLIALALVLFLGLGVLTFFLLNGYLLGREYFQFAALRHRPMDEVTALQQRHGGEIFLAGLAIAAVLTIPIVNFLTPLFAGALMVHIYKGIEAKSG